MISHNSVPAAATEHQGACSFRLMKWNLSPRRLRSQSACRCADCRLCMFWPEGQARRGISAYPVMRNGYAVATGANFGSCITISFKSGFSDCRSVSSDSRSPSFGARCRGPSSHRTSGGRRSRQRISRSFANVKNGAPSGFEPEMAVLRTRPETLVSDSFARWSSSVFVRCLAPLFLSCPHVRA